jgi:hypothetical protein
MILSLTSKQTACLAGVAVLLLLNFGCKKESKKTKITVAFDYSKFLEMRQNWNNLNVENYEYTYLHQGCICFSLKYTVKQDTVIKTEPVTTVCTSFGPPLYYTINQIFSNIEAQYLNPYVQEIDNETYVYCYEMKVRYDSTYYYPNYYEFNYAAKNVTNFCPQVKETLTNFKIQQ